MIDWSNPRGIAAVTRHTGPRLAQRIGQVAPPIYKLMDDIKQFRLSTIAGELLPLGYSMTPHFIIMQDIRATIWFVNASDQSGKWFEQIRATKQNLFFWRLRDCEDKNELWERERQHAERSRNRKPAMWPVDYDITEL